MFLVFFGFWGSVSLSARVLGASLRAVRRGTLPIPRLRALFGRRDLQRARSLRVQRVVRVPAGVQRPRLLRVRR